MRIFVAGATGVLGARAVRLLVAAGHQVTGVALSPEEGDQLTQDGAVPAYVDPFDAVAVAREVDGHDVVMNLATHVPSVLQMALPGAWREHDRIRQEMSANLVAAAIAAGAHRYVQESICFMYADGGDAWLDEDAPMDAPEFSSSFLDAEAQAARFTESGGVGVALRFGQFYAPDCSQTKAMVGAARRGIAPFPGDPESFQPALHADDAATAVVAALEAPAGVYNVVDDRPVTRAEASDALAKALGRRRLITPPRFMEAMGGELLKAISRSERVSNQRFREATGWAPAYPSVREGYPTVV